MKMGCTFMDYKVNDLFKLNSFKDAVVLSRRKLFE